MKKDQIRQLKQKSRKQLLVLLVVLFTIAFVAAGMVVETVRIIQYSASTHPTSVKVQEERDSEGERYYKLIYTYQVYGSTYTVDDTNDSKKTPELSKVTIYYDPQNPSHAETDRVRKMLPVYAVCGSVPVLFLFLFGREYLKLRRKIRAMEE